MGLHVGSGDLIGWQSRVIQPEDVGKTFAQFLSVEVKTPTGRVRPEQLHWQSVVNERGGVAIIVRSPEEAIDSLIQ